MVGKCCKYLLSSLFVFCACLIPAKAEDINETEVSEPSQDLQTEEETKESTDPADAAQMVIDYLEGVRQEEKEAEAEAVRLAEQAEADRKAIEEAEAEKAAEEAAISEEEAEELRSIQLEQERLNATYTSNSNVINGYAQKYKYYYSYDVPYTDGYYTRYDRYIYCWDGFPSFEITGSTLKFSGDALFVSALYNGNTSMDTVSNSISVGGNRTNVYSNIPILAYPSNPSIDKTSFQAADEIIQVITMLGSLCIGWMVTKRFIVDG